MKHSTKLPAVKKPHSPFPLFKHARGYWAKKVRGKLHYFGKVEADPQGQAALLRWLEVKDDLLAGREPRPNQEGFTLIDLCNAFILHKKQAMERGEIGERTFREYDQACRMAMDHFGKRRLVSDMLPEDFSKWRNSLPKTWGAATITSYITRTRVLFRFAYETGLIERPMRFGTFKKPSAKTLRIERAGKPPKLFTAHEIKSVLDAANTQLRCMVLLAINAGMGNTDCATLPLRAIDLKTGWLDFPRQKTGIARRCPLWPETVEALRAVLAKRKNTTKTELKELVFITKQGGSFSKNKSDDPIAKEFAKILNKLNLKQYGRAFYSIRHTHRTISDEARDQPAADAIMGHVSTHISTHYRERIDDSRLLAVSNYVRQWLFSKEVSSNG